MSKDYMTTAEAAALLSVSERTVRNWIRDGVLRAARKQPGDPRSPFLVLRAGVEKIIADRERQVES